MVPVILNIGSQLWQYFSKNKGLNTVSGGFLGAFIALLVENAGQIDNFITWLQNQGDTGLIAGAVVAGLRTALYVWNASRK